MPEKLKSKHLKKSSRNWIKRQINDPYVIMAKKEGYRSRSAFKLLEIQEKFNLIRKDSYVIDLGSSPGGWSQVASKICTKVKAVDLLDMEPIQNVDFIRGDFLAPEVRKLVADELADVVLSDMAPSTCGVQKIDHIRIMGLLEEVFELCKDVLKDGGNLVAKVFQGGTENALLMELRKNFKKVQHFKPKSSRKESSEIYLVALGFARVSNNKRKFT
jgi:23S rRNA (uridine2552-2'-O)-methyltransferase